MIDKNDMLQNLIFFDHPSKPFKHKKKTNLYPFSLYIILKHTCLHCLKFIVCMEVYLFQ